MQLHERSFGGFRLSPKPPTRWDEGSSSRCSRRKREAQSCQPISPAVQQIVLTHTNRLWEEHKNYNSDSTDDKKKDGRIQSNKSPVKKGRLRLAESDCIRKGLKNGVSLCKNVPTRAFFLTQNSPSPHLRFMHLHTKTKHANRR